ncbi:MAG TPA: DUF3592 domain-containing protein [Alphaproteobacteria bacterium]|nr:DUF3592 domain-containing protein [Alphaproteobacteria bacterium]
MTTMQKAIKAGVLLEAILMLAGLGLLAKAVMDGMQTYKFLHSADVEHTAGIVTDIRNHGFSLDFRFTADSNGQMVAPEDGFLPGHHAGDGVPVVFDTHNPADARIDAFVPLWYKALILGPLGFLLFVAGLNQRGRRNL